MDTISLPTNKMNDLLFLCAHDFKHDFLEDKERSGRAMGTSGYAGGANSTEVVTTQETLPVLKIRDDMEYSDEREYSDDRDYSDEPETFRLACYLYLILGESGFDNFCKKIDTFTEIIDEGERTIEHDSKRKASYDTLQQNYDNSQEEYDNSQNLNKKQRRKGGAKTRPANWDRKTGKEKYEYLLKTRSVKPTIGKQRRSGRSRKTPQTLGTFDTSSVEPLLFNPKDAQKWDDYLEIYKEWLGGNDPEKLNKLNEETSQFPVKELKKSWLISSDDWSNVAAADPALYNMWARGVKPSNFKTFFQGIINAAGLPQMSELQISKTNLNKLRKFGSVLLKEWGLFIENRSGMHIYNPKQLSGLSYNDSKMWDDSRSHYKSKYGGNLLENDISTPPGYRGLALSLLASGKLINNSAPLSKYVGDTSSPSKDRKEDKLFLSQPPWICPIPSIIDPQSVCNNIPVRDDQKAEGDDGSPPDFNVLVVGDDGKKKIKIMIEKVAGTTSRYTPTISFQNNSESIVGGIQDDFSNGGIALSAFNITKLFIDKFLVNDLSRDLTLLEQFAKNKQILKEIMGIFAIKLMGDFSQELYSVSKGGHNFVANDRVSAARYLLLKAHGSLLQPLTDGSINRMRLIELQGIGGYLSYSRKINNYFLIQNIPSGSQPGSRSQSPPISRPPSPGTGVGGGKKKKKRRSYKKKKSSKKSRKKSLKTSRKKPLKKSRKKRKSKRKK